MPSSSPGYWCPSAVSRLAARDSDFVLETSVGCSARSEGASVPPRGLTLYHVVSGAHGQRAMRSACRSDAEFRWRSAPPATHGTPPSDRPTWADAKGNYSPMGSRERRDLGPLGLVEGPSCGRRIRRDLLGAGRARDHRYDAGARREPGDRELEQKRGLRNDEWTRQLPSIQPDPS